MCSFISVKPSISKFSRLAQEEVFMLIPCFLKNSNQINMPKMEFVGGYPNEYCIFLENLSLEELKEIKAVNGEPLNFEEVITIINEKLKH